VDEEWSLAETVARTGLPEDLVRHWTAAIDRAEFKRYQAAVILKVSPRAFGRGRRMPLAQRWRSA
jgi:NAD+ synthase (glutamine-hydrolysing)